MAFFKVRGQEVLDMPADQLRNRTVGSKMTESEYEQLVAVAERDGLTLGEWCREVLLAPLAQRQTVTLGDSDKLFVLALGHLRTNGSIAQLIGRHVEDLLATNFEESHSL